MKAADREVEIKLRFASAEDARARIERAGASIRTARHFEDNVLYEDAGRTLKPNGKVLRLRRVGPTGVLTFKAKPAKDSRYKVREEIETAVSEPGKLACLLERIGLTPSYRYQKYRTVYATDAGLQICLDETPLGCFVELEGEPAAIDAFAGKLGFGPADYVLSTYRELQEAATGGEGSRDMVFEDSGGPA